MSPEVRALVVSGNEAEERGDDALAETSYLRAIDLLGPGDPATRGALFVNLGTNAVSAGRDSDAERFFRTAIDTLRDERGEALLQCAHAHYDLARLLLRLDRPEAILIAHEARRLYDSYPFTTPADRADVAIVAVLAAAYIGGDIGERDLNDVWEIVQMADPDELDQEQLFNFLVNWLRLTSVSHPDRFDSMSAAVMAWAPPAMGRQLAAAVEWSDE